MKKQFFFLTIALFLASCTEYGRPKSSKAEGDFVVQFLFEYEGCKIYRFQDGNRFVYWADCRGSIQYEYKEGNGKTSHYEQMQSITTDTLK